MFGNCWQSTDAVNGISYAVVNGVHTPWTTYAHVRTWVQMRQWECYLSITAWAKGAWLVSTPISSDYCWFRQTRLLCDGQAACTVDGRHYKISVCAWQTLANRMMAPLALTAALSPAPHHARQLSPAAAVTWALAEPQWRKLDFLVITNNTWSHWDEQIDEKTTGTGDDTKMSISRYQYCKVLANTRCQYRLTLLFNNN